jgi:hypothetical protein
MDKLQLLLDACEKAFFLASARVSHGCGALTP